MVLCRGDGVLQTFISSRDLKGLQDYIKKGFNVNQINSYGETPLYVASYYGEEQMADILLENGANPNICNCDGDTPLHASALGGFCSILEKLVLNGGDLRLANYQGERVRDLLVYSECSTDNTEALIKHYFDMAEYISCGGNVDSSCQLFNPKESQSRRSKSKLASVCSDRGGAAVLSKQYHCKSQSCIIHTGFGAFSCKGNKAVGYAAHIPIINNEIDLKPDRSAVEVYCNGAFTEIVSMQWRGTAVSVKRVDVQAILNEDCDAPIIGLLLNQPLREIDFMSSLRHPNILTLMAVSPTYYPQNSDVSLSLVFERAHLGSLYHYIHVKLEEVTILSGLTIMRQITEAVTFLHDSDLIHCAITSHAIHLIAPDFAKLGNLEYAIERECNSHSLPNKERICPSSKHSCSLPARNTVPHAVYNWLAPELFQSDVPITTATDVYSMGVLIWETMTGILPHRQSMPEDIFKNWTPAVSPSSVECDAVPVGMRSALRGTQHHHPRARITLEQLYGSLVSSFWNEFDRYTYSPRTSNVSKMELSNDRSDSRNSSSTLMNISPEKKPKIHRLNDKFTTHAMVHHQPRDTIQQHLRSQTNCNNINRVSTDYLGAKGENPRSSHQRRQQQEGQGGRSEDNSESEIFVTTLDESDVLTVTSRKKLERHFSSRSSSSSLHPTTTTTNNEDSPNAILAVRGKPPINNLTSQRPVASIDRMPSSLQQNRFTRDAYKQFAAVPNFNGSGRQGRATYPRRRDTIDSCSTQSSRSRHSSEDDHRVKPASHRTSVSPPRVIRHSDSGGRLDLIKVSSRGLRSPSPPFVALRATQDDPAWQRHKPMRIGTVSSRHTPQETRESNFEKTTRPKLQEEYQTRFNQRGEVIEEPLAKVKTLVSSFEDLDRQSVECKQPISNSTRRSYDMGHKLSRTASLSPILKDNQFVGAINSILQSKQNTINRETQCTSQMPQITLRRKAASSTGIDFKAVQEKWKRSAQENKPSDQNFQTAKEIYNEDAMKAGFTSANQVLKNSMKCGSVHAKASFNTARELYNRVAKKAQVQLVGDIHIAKKQALLSIVDESVNSPEMASTPVYANTNKADEYRYVSSSSGPENVDHAGVNDSKSDNNDEIWTTALLETVDISSDSVIDPCSAQPHKTDQHEANTKGACIEVISHHINRKQADGIQTQRSTKPPRDNRPERFNSEIYLPHCVRNHEEEPSDSVKNPPHNTPFHSSSEANISDIEPRTVIKRGQPHWIHRRHSRRITKIQSRPLSTKEVDSGSGRNTWDELDPSDVWSDDERWREALYSENFWDLGVKWPENSHQKESRPESIRTQSSHRSCDNIHHLSGSTSSIHRSHEGERRHHPNNVERPFRDLTQSSHNVKRNYPNTASYAKNRLRFSQESLAEDMKEDRENRPNYYSNNGSPNSASAQPSAQFVTPASGASDEDWEF